MQLWMMGVVAGIVWVGLWPRIPPPVFLLWLLPLIFAPLVFKSARTLLPAGLSLGLLVGCWHGQELLGRRLPADCVGETVTVEGVISSLPRLGEVFDGRPRQRFEFTVSRIVPDRCAGPWRVLLSYYGEQRMVPGERWRFSARLKRPLGLSNPGSYNLQAWFAQSGIDATGSVSVAPAHKLEEAVPRTSLHHRLRQEISERIATASTNPDVVAVLQAVTVADKSGIDGRFWTLLQKLGISHLMVISGLHIGLVAGVVYLASLGPLRFLPGEGRWRLLFPRVAALLAAAGYTALAGFSLSTVRALTMLGCFIVADLAGRQGGAWTRLLLAALLILVGNPLAGLGSGFWLSFAAVASLLWFGRWQRSSLPLRLFGTHLFMSLAMVPASAWWFGGASLVSAPANILMIPLVGFLVVPPALGGALLALLGSQFDRYLWRLAAWPLEQVLPLAHTAVDAGGRWLHLPMDASPASLFLATFGVLLWAVPAAPRYRCLALGLCLPLVLSPASPDEVSATDTRVTVFDVGQGTAALLESGGRALLYDTGGGDPAGANMARSVILPYLRTRGISHLDTIVVSHSDLDHASGVVDILAALPVKRRYHGDKLASMPGGRRCIAGEAWAWPGGQRFRFLSPGREAGLSSNDASCVLLVEAAGWRLLFPGDIEADRERELVAYWGDELQADWLLAAHHGSKTSSGPTFLKHVRPRVVVISHGYANRFGHPHPVVLKRLRGAAPAVYSTAEEGALTFEFTPSGLVGFQGHRWQGERYWM